jgi:hypothetical protein
MAGQDSSQSIKEIAHAGQLVDPQLGVASWLARPLEPRPVCFPQSLGSGVFEELP